MAGRKEHCLDCKEKMGKEWDKVHAWLDGKACIMVDCGAEGLVPHLDMNHRRHRHHQAGIEEVRKKWGDEAAEAARLHILLDYGYIPTMDDYSSDKESLVRWKLIFGKDWTEKS